MNTQQRTRDFEDLVGRKFTLYNSLFLSLPFQGISRTGMLVPLLGEACRKGLADGRSPREILDSFFRHSPDPIEDGEVADFLFRVIQYVERQIVLYDSVEDAAFADLQRGGPEWTLREILHAGRESGRLESLKRKLRDFGVRIVLTAHPTQFYSPSVLGIMAELRALIGENRIDSIDRKLRQLGMTSLVNSRKPTPLDEARNILYFLRDVYYDAIGELHENLAQALDGEDLQLHRLVQLGFWPGGDRDGNPFVTAEVTTAVADELRMSLMQCYTRELQELRRKLTFRGIEEELESLLHRLREAAYDPAVLVGEEEILQALQDIRGIVIQKYNSLYLEDLERLIRKVRIFGTRFASLDVRQNHSIHRRALNVLLKAQGRIQEDLQELEREDLLAQLLREPFGTMPFRFEDPLVEDVFRTVYALGPIQRANGEAGCHRYVISHAEDADSVLFVYGLFGACGYDRANLPFDIVPLFESMRAMENAEGILRELFELPEYREHLRRRGDTQTVMLGFSDGTKDGGFLMANWSILRTKERISELCGEFGIRPLFFDGRGGPPARGGGRAQRFYAAQGPRIANREIQLTIQGQTISSKYGTREQFLFNCEQLLGAGLSLEMQGERNELDHDTRELIDELARVSHASYLELKNHPRFVSYLEHKSTLRYYKRANVGSRPTQRGGEGALSLEDLRAIPFVGAWSQLKQNVPGYYGLGTACSALAKRVGMERLQELYREQPFFRALIDNGMMSLTKCNFALTAYMESDPEYGGFWKLLQEEFELSKRMALEISESGELMEREPLSRLSIGIRERIVLPLLVIQQYALQQLEGKPEKRGVWEKVVERSLYGNINASRNSA